MRIFLDANILFSASSKNGAIRELLGLIREIGHGLVADEYVIHEAMRSLVQKQPSATFVLNALISELPIETLPTFKTHLDDSIALDFADRPVLAAAIAAGCEALLTGDKSHLGHLYGKTVSGVSVHSSRSLAQALFD